MIVKGFGSPNVTLVGVLNTGTPLNSPGSRSSGRTLQLLTQVAGRIGYTEKESEVLIQTYSPQRYTIQLAQKRDYEAFYTYEMGIRRQSTYPPYYFAIGLILLHKDEQVAIHKSSGLLQSLRRQLSDKTKILGSTPRPIIRTHNLYHYQIIVEYRSEDNLKNVLNRALDLTQLSENKSSRLVIDYEPQNFM